jgi:hypothetical protein
VLPAAQAAPGARPASRRSLALKTALRWLAGIAAGVIVLALAVALSAAWWFDSDALKREIEIRVEKETGLALSITGELSLSLFPRPGVKVGHTALANAPGFGVGGMAEFQALSLRLRLKPLLQGTAALDAVVVEGLKLHLVRDATGRHNYDALRAPSGGSGNPPPGLLAMGGVTLVDAALTYDDRISGETLRITNLDFHSGPLSAHGPVPVAAHFRYNHPARGVEGDASIRAGLTMGESLKRFRLESIALAAAIRGAEIPGGELRLQSEGGLIYEAMTRMLSLDNIQLDAIDPSLMDSPIRLRIPRAVADLGAGTASTEGFFLRALEVDIQGDLAVSAPGAGATVTGSIRILPFNPRGVFARLGGTAMEKDPERWPNEAQLESGFSGDNRSVTLDPFVLTLDGTQISGRIDFGFAPEWPLTVALRTDGPWGARDDPVALSLRGSGSAGAVASIYRFSDIELRLGSLTARGEVQVRADDDPPQMTATLELPAFDPRALLGQLGIPLPETRDPEALTRLAARAVVSGDEKDLELDPLTLALDDTQVSGSVSVADAFSESPAVSFALRADALDTRRYLPFKLPGTEQEAAAPASLGVLQSLNLNGSLRFGALVIGDVTLDDVEVVSRSRSGRLELRSGPNPPTASSGGRSAASDSPLPSPP